MKKKLGILLFAISVSLAASDWVKVSGGATAGANLENISGFGSFSKKFNVAPGKDYLFSAEVLSDSAVTVTIRAPEIHPNYWKKIAYPRTGEKQTLYGFYNSRNAKFLQVVISVAPLREGVPGKTEIRHISLRETDFRNLQPVRKKEISSKTVLDADSTIVVPEGTFYRALAEKIRAKLNRAPAIMTDKEACEPDQPTLRKEFAGKNLILLGNLDTNRAFWPACTSMLAASDNYYPGPRGYEIRTAVDVLRNGRNHIIVGSSTPEGVGLAVERFLSIVRPELPFLLEVKLDGECKKVVEEDIARWKQFPNGNFPQKEAGYHTIRRWYHNAIAYYWTGDAFYRDMAKKLFQPVLKDNAYTHHYIMEWLFKTWRMVEPTDLYSEAEKAQAERLLLNNYLELQTGADLIWFRFWTPPYQKLIVNSRHITSPLMCLVETSDYVRNSFDLPSPLRELADFTWDESSRAMRGVAMTRRQDSLPGEAGGGGLDELSLSVYRFTLKYGMYDFFRSGQAKQWSQLEFRDHSNVRDNILFRSRYNFKLPAAILAAYYRDPGYQYYWETCTFNILDQGMFNDRYVCGIGTFQSNVKSRMPEEINRLAVVKTSEHDLLNTAYFNFLSFRFNPAVLKQTPADMVILKGGTRPGDSLLAVSGAKRYIANPGEIVQFSVNGTGWLHNSWTGLYSNDTGTPFERNMLYVNRSKQPANAVGIYSALAGLEWSLCLPGVQGASLCITPFNGVEWKRRLYRVNPNAYLVYDTARALLDDDFDIAVTWRPMHGVKPNAVDTLFSILRNDLFSIVCSGEGFTLETNTGNYLDKISPRLNSHFAFHGSLKKGDRLAAASLLQVNGKLAVAELGNGKVALLENGKPVSEIIFTDSGVREIGRRQIAAARCTRFELDGNLLFQSEKPADMVWDFETAMLHAADTQPRKMDAAENHRVRGLCEKYLASIALPEKNPSSAGEQPDLKTVPCLTKKWSCNPFREPVVVNLGYGERTLFDLGETVRLSEIRNLNASAKLPDSVEISENGSQWKKLPLKPVWISGQTVRNYGETIPIAEYCQIATLEPAVPARYVRCANPERLEFLRSDKLAPARPVKILSVHPNILAANEILKAWPRRYLSESSTFAVLSPEGKEKFVYRTRDGLHELKVLDYPELDSIGMVTADGRILFFDSSGKVLRRLNANDDLKAFNDRYGRPGTRQPAGGFSATYSLGAWRNPVQLIAPRYGQLSFYGNKGDFAGLLQAGTYGMAHILNRGCDFNGDGVEEQIALGPNTLVHIDGTDKSYVRSPGSAVFWPEVFTKTECSYPVGWNINFGTYGARVLCFKQLDFGPGKYVPVVARTYLGIYDGKLKKYAYIRVPLSPISAADIIRTGPSSWKGVISQEDNSVTIFDWKEKMAGPVLSKLSIPDEINAIHITKSGRVFLAGNKGLYELTGSRAVQRLEGMFTDVKSGENELLTAEADGTVSCWKTL